jgi:excisionase family DNA binding protein
MNTNQIAQAERAVYQSVDELAGMLGINRQRVYAGLRDGQIPSIRLGRRFLLPRDAINSWLRTAGGSLRASS